jgi:hypothetical protein
MEDLRRLTVKVLLALLVFQTVGNYLDDVFLGNRYAPVVEIYALLAGMITGLFTPEIFRSRKSREDEISHRIRQEDEGRL